MKYILYGAGPYLKKCIDSEKANYFSYIVDQAEEKIGTMYLGLDIKSPSVLLEEKKDEIFIVITAYGQLYSIEYDLKKMGFLEGIHFIWFGRLSNLYPEHRLWLDKRSDNWKKDEVAWRASFENEVLHERAVLVGKMIEWDSVNSLLDLGSGSEPMKPLIPEGCSYFPVDYKQLTRNTMVYDFNKKEFPDISADVVVLIGVHGYVDYELWLIDKAISAVNPGGQLLISCNYCTGNLSVLDLLKKYSGILMLCDYAFRDEFYGIFKLRRISK